MWAVAFMRSEFGSAPGTTLLVRAMQIDWKVLLFTLGLSVASTLFFGLIPAWRGSRANLHGTIYKQVIRQGMVVTLLGLIVGLAGGYGVGVVASATLSPLIDATDTMAFAPITATLIAVALLACYIPARRPARVDPTVALRYE